MRTGPLLFLLLLVGCGPDGTGEFRAVNACGQDRCGCSHPAAITLSGRTVDVSRTPVSGINVLCEGEAEPLDASDQSGSFRAEVLAQQTPGCGFSRCNQVRFVDPAGRFQEVLRDPIELGGDVVLPRR